MNCPHCGKPLKNSNRKFCPSCGKGIHDPVNVRNSGRGRNVNDLSYRTNQTTPPVRKQKGMSNMVIAGTISTLCVAVVIVFGLLFFKIYRHKHPVTTVASTPEATTMANGGQSSSNVLQQEATTEATTDTTVQTDTTPAATTEAIDSEVDSNPESEYVFPDSDSRYLTEKDVSGLSKSTLKIGRNEIYARHGYIFETDSLKKHFKSCSWYHPTTTKDDFSESCFNKYENANIAFIKEYEDKASDKKDDDKKNTTASSEKKTTSSKKQDTSTTAPAATTAATTATTAATTETDDEDGSTGEDEYIEGETSVTVCLDAEYQAEANTEQEAIGPDSEETADKMGAGSVGVTSGSSESELNLKIAKKVKEYLEDDESIKVVMTRTENDVDLSNKDRAEIASKNNANVYVHICCSDESDESGVKAICISPDNPFCKDQYDASSDLASIIHSDVIDELSDGDKEDSGVLELDDYSELNWATMPSCIIQVGNINIDADDTSLNTDEYQTKVANGIANGIIDYIDESFAED